MKTDVTSIGELLIDLTQKQPDENGIVLFAANPGGAPANVAVAAARLGAKSAFVGKTGADGFGNLLRAALEKEGVNISALHTDDKIPTTLAVVSVADTGERSFAFYRSPGADEQLRSEEIPHSLLENSTFVHFGSISLTAEPARTATLDAVLWAKEHGVTISYDPNYRAALWPDEATAAEWMRAPLEWVDILKLSDEELELMTGTTDLQAGTALLAKSGIRLALVTLGAKGVFWRMNGETGTVPGVPVQVADTNGAGDTFLGAVLSRMAQEKLLPDSLSREKLEEILRFANQAAALTTSRPGAIPAMPTRAEVLAASVH